MDFTFEGRRIQRTTHLSNKELARRFAQQYHAKLVNEGIGFIDREPAPRLREFSKRFLDTVAIRKPDKPATVQFYRSKMKALLEFGPLAEARLNEIDENLINRFVQHRSKQLRAGDLKNKKAEGKRISPATVNRSLTTLRALLYMARELGLINRVPKIRLLSGEGRREFILSHEQEEKYLHAAPQPLRDIAVLILDTGLRHGEALNLKWADVFAEGTRSGYLLVRKGKSDNAKRAVVLTKRVREMLIAKRNESSCAWVFPNKGGTGPLLVTSLDHTNAKLRKQLGLPQEFVIHSLRHTMLTRLGESGTDAFTIMKIAGHSSITVSQRYVHPSQRAVEVAFNALERHNEDSFAELREGKAAAVTADSASEDRSRDLSQVFVGSELQ